MRRQEHGDAAPRRGHPQRAQGAGIEVIVLKGLYLVEHIYPSIGLRTFGDLDLLVRKERLADALVVMQGLGYKLSTWYDPREANTDIKHLPPLEKVDAPTVEMHWTILEEDEPFSIDTRRVVAARDTRKRGRGGGAGAWPRRPDPAPRHALHLPAPPARRAAQPVRHCRSNPPK